MSDWRAGQCDPRVCLQYFVLSYNISPVYIIFFLVHTALWHTWLPALSGAPRGWLRTPVRPLCRQATVSVRRLCPTSFLSSLQNEFRNLTFGSDVLDRVNTLWSVAVLWHLEDLVWRISVNTDSLSPSITTNPLHDYSVTGCFIQALGSCQFMTKFCNHLNHLMQSSYGISMYL